MLRGRKLRARAVARPFRVVLVEPEIPPNTGAIARTCAATGSPLHLVGPLGFDVDSHAVRRAGLDYWDLVTVHRHLDFADFCKAHPEVGLHLFSSRGVRSYLEAEFAPGQALVFGRESTGLDDSLLDAHADRVWAIPTLGPVRSLNLSNAVAVALYRALERIGALDDLFVSDS